MRLPTATAGFMTRVGFGHYVWRRLLRAGFDDLATSADLVNTRLLAAGRRVEDLGLPQMAAIADRDSADDDLDDTAQDLRLKLASRRVGAHLERPYSDVFPQGIEYYTAASLGLQTTRYGELIQRTVEHLPEADPVRTEGAPKLAAQLELWEVSSKEVGTARNTLAIGRTARDAAVDDWITTMERVYGALIMKVGKKKAERFFPRTDRKRVDDGGRDPDE